ncbi:MULTISPECIES: thiamine-phosphate synthase family protein [unclassified Methanoregula]|uniref:thiamine-phosphate synthase family protein n=1 Tax=unclassified Methanoregula TaxID=2649730 RepID=UPI0009CF3A85|nr:MULTISPECIES: thiamine-phosphate synthase family protein [unclassified Methanoregula]OPX63885.1 MAG: Bifunctional thiamine biosynthesis protein ThiDN [Methanoregula sp. PtaB.Bin085]OPY35438.1 MAG: Bifunctional thiamine biosynthesis protein ThiDN [Methanoregula sp. PtaU1.Bin006]
MDPVQERSNTLAALQAAVTQTEGSASPRLVPPEGISFGYALRGARDAGSVAAAAGGIRKGAGGSAAASCSFGTGEPVVPVILTIMKFDPAIRSAAILQYSDRALRVFENDLFLECALLDAASSQKGISTMDWGIASCCKEEIPDVIYRRGTTAADSRIILPGEDPADVLNNIIICSNRI